MKKHLFIIKICSFLTVLFLFFGCSQATSDSPIPQNSRQMVLVLTGSAIDTTGYFIRFERVNSESNWEKVGQINQVVIGRNGLAWGRGLNPIDSLKLSIKVEGDGKSPAGVFKLSKAFGYAPEEEMGGLKVPYIHISEMSECIDDINSKYYNQIILRNEINDIDWLSSEKMCYSGIYYEMGLIIDQNIDPIVKGAGSCIFIHNWLTPEETSAGCTEVNPEKMKEIIYWLDASMNPVLVQLTSELYNDYQKTWGLPDKFGGSE